MTNAPVDALVSIIAKSCKGVIGYICHEEAKMKDGDRFADSRRRTERVDNVSRNITAIYNIQT
jgi:hypothetical protein